MKKASTLKTSKRKPASKTDWPRIKAMRDADIDLSDIPEVTASAASRGVVRIGAGERGYQTLINTALKEAIAHESLEDTLRRVVREEVAPYRVSKKQKHGS
jgi:hypothetical protein